MRREARGGVGGGGGAGGGGHGAGARGWWRARHPRALRGRRSDSHACGQRRRVVRRAASRRARCARGRRALVGDSSLSEERGAGAGASRDARSLKSPSQTRKTIARLGVRCLFRVRRTPTPSASNWPRYLPRKLVGGGWERRRRRSDVSSACNFAPRARGASRCMRGAENLVLQEGQAARRDLTRALKAGPPGVPRDHSLFDFVWISCSLLPPSVPGAPDTRCLLRRFPVQV